MPQIPPIADKLTVAQLVSQICKFYANQNAGVSGTPTESSQNAGGSATPTVGGSADASRAPDADGGGSTDAAGNANSG